MTNLAPFRGLEYQITVLINAKRAASLDASWSLDSNSPPSTTVQFLPTSLEQEPAIRIKALETFRQGDDQRPRKTVPRGPTILDFGQIDPILLDSFHRAIWHGHVDANPYRRARAAALASLEFDQNSAKLAPMPKQVIRPLESQIRVTPRFQYIDHNHADRKT